MTKKPKPKMVKKPATTTALITGAGSGIGLAFVEDFLSSHKPEQGWGEYGAILMVARNPAKLKKTATQLREKYSQSSQTPEILTLAMDLSQPEAASRLMTFIKNKRLKITALINNAGIGYMGDFTAMPPNKILEIVNLNITSLTQLSHTLLNHMRSHQEPRSPNPILINVASVVGLFPTPLSTVYAATKAYVVSFTEALRAECQEEISNLGRGVEVYTLCPGSTETSFFERVTETGKKLEMGRLMSPVQVVNETREAVIRKQGLIIPGTSNRLVPLLVRFLPKSWVIRLSHRFMKKRLSHSSPTAP